MKENQKNAIEKYQCPGCVCGSDIECFKPCEFSSLACGKHVAGTNIFPMVGRIILGMPIGFCRLGDLNTKIQIYESYEKSDWQYDKFNIAVWKYLNELDHTLVRGMTPRTNKTFIHIFLENCIGRIDCLELTKTDIDAMD